MLETLNTEFSVTVTLEMLVTVYFNNILDKIFAFFPILLNFVYSRFPLISITVIFLHNIFCFLFNQFLI